jgi:hypothetical protein
METIEGVAATEMGSTVAILDEAEADHCPDRGAVLIPDGAIKLRCFVRRLGSGRFLAECIDLDLGAEAESIDSAKASLTDAIVGYLMVMLEGIQTEEQFPEAILRRSPLTHRLRYYFEYWRFRLGAAVFGQHQRPTECFYKAPLGFPDCGTHASC